MSRRVAARRGDSATHQHDPHCAWSFTCVTAPFERQSTAAARASISATVYVGAGLVLFGTTSEW